MCKTSFASTILDMADDHRLLGYFSCDSCRPALTSKVKASGKMTEEYTWSSSDSEASIESLSTHCGSLGSESVLDCEDIREGVLSEASAQEGIDAVDFERLFDDGTQSFQGMDELSLREIEDTLFESINEEPPLPTLNEIEDLLFELEMEQLPVGSKRKLGCSVGEREAFLRGNRRQRPTGLKAGQHSFVKEQADVASLQQKTTEIDLSGPKAAIHETVKQYSCPHGDCKKSYATIEGLRLHNRNYHEINKPWRCFHAKCTQSFVRKSDLKLHILREHVKERPFACTESSCTRRFVCHSELRRHLSKFHNLALPKPSKTSFQPPNIAALDNLVRKAEEHYKRK